jgi:hypothetical protein
VPTKTPASGGVPPAVRVVICCGRLVPSIQLTVIWVWGVKFCGVILAYHCPRPVGLAMPA